MHYLVHGEVALAFGIVKCKLKRLLVAFIFATAVVSLVGQVRQAVLWRRRGRRSGSTPPQMSTPHRIATRDQTGPADKKR